MIRSSRLAAGFCGVAALCLHGAGLWVSETPVAIEIEGGGEFQASLGSSFADMAAGTAQPVKTETIATQPGAAEAANPAKLEEAQPTKSDVQEAVTDTHGATDVTPTADATPEPLKAPATTRAEATVAAQMVTAAPSANFVMASRPEIEAAKATEPHRNEATRRSEQAVETSLRPQSRPRNVERSAARQDPAPKPKPSASNREGNNATRDARRGSTTGRENASAAQTTGQSHARRAAEGNAAASNYPGQVMRHLARVPRPRSQGLGAAIVQFTIAQNGRLSAIGLARSSGSDRLDRSALAVIQRAAPFPAPPQGARRSFSIKIEGQ